jgi:hypothetical protein
LGSLIGTSNIDFTTIPYWGDGGTLKAIGLENGEKHWTASFQSLQMTWKMALKCFSGLNIYTFRLLSKKWFKDRKYLKNKVIRFFNHMWIFLLRLILHK